MLTYYKKIELENFDTVIEKCLAYIKGIDTIYNRKTPRTSWYNVSVEELTSVCPELVTAFNKYDLKIVMAAAYVMYHNSHTLVHVDNYKYQTRINLPLLNCKNTYTNFYESDGELVKWVNPQSGEASYSTTGKTRLVDRVEIEQATVIRVAALHDVALSANAKVPRITLTLGFDKDTTFLLE